ncbi:hypothetical protein ACSBR1_033491 [Camellia fascicularis]
MARDEAPAMRLEALGEDDAVELAEQYRTERREERGAEQVVQPHPSTMIVVARPISQVGPDHWHTKANKSTFTVEELEEVRKKYQIPAEIELKLLTSKERVSDARLMEFMLYEEALRGGLRLPLPQIVVDVLNRLEVALGLWSTRNMGDLAGGGGQRISGGFAIVGEGVETKVVLRISKWRERVRTIWKIFIKSVQPRLEAEAEDRVKRVKEWRENEDVK